MKNIPYTSLLIGLLGWQGVAAQAVGPEVSSWIRNTTGATGYNGIQANCQTVQYSTNFVYVSATGVPAYNIGPWAGNPNTPSNQNWVMKFSRNPVENTGAKTNLGLGQVALFSNGVVAFNAEDAFSYNNQGIWHQDANVFEGASFDASGGHPAPNGAYHYHQNPALLSSADSTVHSPIIGYAFDGFPIYGPFGYSDPMNASSGIQRMAPGYGLRNITQRTSLPDGTMLQAAQYGPAVSAQYPLGSYIEDYIYTAGSGDLDQYNGRLCVTPDYPGGTYAYFATTNGNNEPIYPYFLAEQYYGVVTAGNTGPGGGHVTVSEPTTVYTGAVAITDPATSSFSLSPNPSEGSVEIRLNNTSIDQVQVLNQFGQRVYMQTLDRASSVRLDLSDQPAGLYFVQLSGQGQRSTQKLILR